MEQASGRWKLAALAFHLIRSQLNFGVGGLNETYDMNSKRKMWYALAVGLSVVNWIGLGLASQPAEPLHATIHGVLALAFAYWAHRLRSRFVGGELADRLEGRESREELEAEVQTLRQALTESLERLDSAERRLAQGAEVRQARPER